MDSTAISHARMAWHAPIWSHELGGWSDGTRYLRATSPFQDTGVSDPMGQSTGARIPSLRIMPSDPSPRSVGPCVAFGPRVKCAGVERLPPRRQARFEADSAL